MWILFDNTTDSVSKVSGHSTSCGFHNPATPFTLNGLLRRIEEPKDEMSRPKDDKMLS